jgi:hypothetical protein
MRQVSNYKYVSLIPIEGIEKIIHNLAINKDILDVGFLLSEVFEPV